MRSRSRLVELVLVLALIIGGAWLRWLHLDTPSLWWDELVQIRTVEHGTAAEVWRAARDGVVPGTGNAGAMPVDYLVLHAWLRVAPPPSPATMERHYRVPAFVLSVAALPLMWALGRAVGGPVAGAVALALLATAIPPVLYAAEARFYSLSVVATIVNLLAFATVVRAATTARLVVFMLASIAYVLSALYGIFVVAAEHLVLAGVAWRASRDRRGIVTTAASALPVVAVLWLWLGPSAIGAGYGRGVPDFPPLLSSLSGTFLFFAGNAWPLAVLLAAGLVAAPFVVRERQSRVVATVCLLALCSVPVMVLVAHWKRYYFHPRHALFLLPMVHLATALALGSGLARVARRPLATLAGALLPIAFALPAVCSYVTEPLTYFRVTKTLRDFRGLAETIAARTATQPPDAKLLLVLEGRRAGHLANPTLAFYLDAHGLADRVMLAAVGDPLPVLRDLARLCPDGCRGPLTVELLQQLGVRDPFDQPPLMRRLMRLRPSPPAAVVAGVMLVAWAPTSAPAPPGIVDTRLDGLTLYEPAAR